MQSVSLKKFNYPSRKPRIPIPVLQRQELRSENFRQTIPYKISAAQGFAPKEWCPILLLTSVSK